MAANLRLQYVRGVPMPDVEWFKKKNIEDAMDYMPRDGDVIVASYPKTGTTWLQYIVLQILTNGERYPSFDDLTYKIAPYMEMAGVQPIEALPSPRFYKHHLPYNMVRINDKAKTIYIYRHPADTFVSYYHFLNELNIIDATADINELLEAFLSGKISYGNYFHHVLSFYEHRNDDSLLMVSYEKLLKNRKGEILRIAEFLGDYYHRYLTQNEDTLSKIIKQTDFDYMKKNLSLTHPTKGTVVDFFRKGTSGDGKISLTQEQKNLIEDSMFRIMEGTDILRGWVQDA